MNRDYIDLDRSFTEVRDDESMAEDEGRESRFYRLFAKELGDTLDWPALLEKRYFVVLGEAGSGKTVEFQHYCAWLAEQGKPAFYCRIEDLAQEGLQASLGDECEAARFE